MDEIKERYEKAVKILRGSKPVLSNREMLEDTVIGTIRDKKHKQGMISAFIESIYGWIYIGWVRRSLVGAALIMFSVFLYQQADILRSVRSLEKEVVSIKSGQPSVNIRDLERRLTIFKKSSNINSENKIEIDESQLKEFVDSYKDLELRYEYLNRMIQGDTLLKEYFMKKVEEAEKNRLKI